MAENIILPDINISKEDKYRNLLPQIKALVGNETDYVANMANISAALKQTFGFFWVGFYVVKGGELILGPFQGPVACTRISYGRGVCGTAWKEKQTVVVSDVNRFPGHIACNSKSKSEIVIPIFKYNDVIGVLDIDSDRLDDFNETDVLYLKQICNALPLL